MTTEQDSRPHIFQHVPTGKFLELWIDGWYLVGQGINATKHTNETTSTEEVIPMLEQLFYGEIKMIFIDELSNFIPQPSPSEQIAATA